MCVLFNDFQKNMMHEPLLPSPSTSLYCVVYRALLKHLELANYSDMFCGTLSGLHETSQNPWLHRLPWYLRFREQLHTEFCWVSIILSGWQQEAFASRYDNSCLLQLAYYIQAQYGSSDIASACISHEIRLQPTGYPHRSGSSKLAGSQAVTFALYLCFYVLYSLMITCKQGRNM
jgi:hypothetical protein